MTKNDSFISSLKNRQLTSTVFDKNEQAVLEEGIILSSAEFLILKSRDIELGNIEVQRPIAISKRNQLFRKLEGELLLEMDYPGKLNTTAQPGQLVTHSVLQEISKLNICPSYFRISKA